MVSSQGGVGRSESWWDGVGGERVPSGFIFVVVMEWGAEVAEPLRDAERSAAMSRSVLCLGRVRDGWERGTGSFLGFARARRSFLFVILWVPWV